MSKENDKAPNPIKSAAAAKTPPVKPVPVKPAPVKVAPLFRPIDWMVLFISFAAVWAVYLWTLAPELTLEDSGELCTASFYAGIPHPPGYPFWAICTRGCGRSCRSATWRGAWRWANRAAAAFGCGLVGFTMVSRGSSMLIEGIEELKTLDRKWENAICIVTGIVAKVCLLGFDGFTWKGIGGHQPHLAVRRCRGS